MTRMKLIGIGAALCAAGAASAQSLRVNDIHYIAAARCQGLYTAPDLGSVDPTGINRFMDLESAGRPTTVMDQATTARNDAKREAATGGAEARAKMIAERDGPCREWWDIGANAAHSQLTGGGG